jgi:pilus assembly protein CpaC
MHKFLALAATVSWLALSVVAAAAEPAASTSGANPGGPATATPPPKVVPAPIAAAPIPAAPSAGLAATPPPSAPSGAAVTTAPAQINEVATNGAPIVLDVNKGLLIHLPRPAGTVFIANPEIADVQVKSPQMIYLVAKSPGETALYAVDASDRVMVHTPVRVEHDLTRVRQSLSALAPGESVNVSSVDNSLVLRGSVSNAGEAEKMRSFAASIASETKGNVVNELSVATPNQVNIRVKIAEVDRNVLKAMGVNWQKLTGDIQFATENPFTSGQINIANQLFTFIGGHNGQMLAAFDALAQEGLVTTLAEPNLTATNGQPASFLAGGEFPVPVAGAAATGGGIPTISIEFKTFGVSLDVTPTIIDAQHITLRIRPEVSALTTTGEISVPLSSSATVVIPALTVRRAETTVQLASGQSFILGGLLQNNVTELVTKIPALGDIPVLGQLFRSQQFQKNESELVILVTPYLVRPVATSSLQAPTDGFFPPHDAQSVISGDTHRQTLPAPAVGPVNAGGQGPVGLVGFRLD